MKIAILLLASASVFAQTASKATDISVQNTTTQTLLVKLAKQNQDSQKTINDLNQQARIALDQKNNPVIEKIKAKYKDWETKAEADTKSLHDQVDANLKEAQVDLQKKIDAVPSITSPATFIELEKAVRKEQNLPDNAVFDLSTGKWSVPETPEK